MNFRNLAVSLTLVLFAFCDAAFVDNLPKCSLDDNECLRVLYEVMIRDIGKHGVPDLKIPPVDPIQLKNISVSVLDMANLTMVEGVMTGIKDCLFEKFSINITGERGYQENTCDLTIKGHYKIESSSPLLQQLVGGNAIHGEGRGKVKIDQLHLKFDFPFYAQKRDDGEIYIKCIYDLIKYKYDIRGKVSFFADNIYVGDQEMSKPITEMINQNWRFVMSMFGQPFVDKAMEIYFQFAGFFFDNVPARHFILDDLSPYARP